MDTKCQGGCRKLRSILHADDPKDWLCNECRQIKKRLEYLRGELRAERISYAELNELQGLAKHISSDDVELLEAAGVPESKPEEWLVRITVLRNGEAMAENIYEYENEEDAMESAFGACQEALNDSTEQHSADIQGAEDEMERARR